MFQKNFKGLKKGGGRKRARVRKRALHFLSVRRRVRIHSRRVYTLHGSAFFGVRDRVWARANARHVFGGGGGGGRRVEHDGRVAKVLFALLEQQQTEALAARRRHVEAFVGCDVKGEVHEECLVQLKTDGGGGGMRRGEWGSAGVPDVRLWSWLRMHKFARSRSPDHFVQKHPSVLAVSSAVRLLQQTPPPNMKFVCLALLAFAVC
jgi:hypothetical protein